MKGLYRFGWFSTGANEAARDLLTAAYESIRQGEIEGEIEFVFCSREPGEKEESDRFIRLVEEYKIPLVCYSYQKLRKELGEENPDPAAPMPQWRLDYDREIIKRLNGFNPGLSVLAGFMLITGPELCERYDMVNLHPALPGGPVGTWQQVIWELIGENAKETGALMNLVTPELDKGPVVAYCGFPIRGEPFDTLWQQIEGISVQEIKKKEGTTNTLFKEIRRHGLEREFPLITATMKAFSQGKIRITPEKQVVDAENRPIKGYNLSEEIDAKVKGIL